MKAVLVDWLDRGRATAFELGPYAAAAVLLPGGTLMLGVAWLARHWGKRP
jgi:hypothetical protein